jgi:hypothetical protein
MEVIDLKAPEPVDGTPPCQDPQWLAELGIPASLDHADVRPGSRRWPGP